jgi:Uma2 family endonuclease
MMADMLLEPVVQLKTVSQAALQAREADADDGVYFEVVDGEIVEEKREMTWKHADIIEWLVDFLRQYARAHDLGTVHGDGRRYILIGSNSAIRIARQPDLSFLRKGRIPDDFDPDGDFEGAPDLAVEVASPGQSAPKLLKKLTEYIDAGSEEAWLLNYRRKQLHRIRYDIDGYEVHSEGDSFETPLFPGLTIVAADIFAAKLT